jgi:hypothetical protein
MNIIKPPFAWLSKYTAIINEVSLLAVAAFMRVYQLNALPFGLSTDEARVGLSASNLVHHGWWPGFSLDSVFSPLWTVLQALPVAVFGNTVWALRLWPVVFGVVAVWATWRWSRTWFGDQVGWMAAFLVAVIPWAISASRDAAGSVLPMALLPLGLWLYTRTVKHNKLADKIGLTVVAVVCLFAGPLSWTIDAVLLFLVARQLIAGKRLPALSPVNLGVLGSLAAAAAAFALALLKSSAALGQLWAYYGWTLNPLSLAESFSRTVLMFVIRGDESWLRNFSGDPMLNPFVGLMFVVGIMVVVVHYRSKRHLMLLGALVFLLLPAILSIATTPNSALAAVTVPITAVLASIGMTYMLMLWRVTFPLNSAARSTGVAVITLLLLLTLVQSYTQYFNAWAKSAESYAAYNETAVYVGNYLKANEKGAFKYVVATAQEQTIIDYLNWNPKYKAIRAADINNLSGDNKGREFALTTSVRTEAAVNLTAKLPGGILRPYLSKFSQEDVYYVYEAPK